MNRFCTSNQIAKFGNTALLIILQTFKQYPTFAVCVPLFNKSGVKILRDDRRYNKKYHIIDIEDILHQAIIIFQNFLKFLYINIYCYWFLNWSANK